MKSETFPVSIAYTYVHTKRHYHVDCASHTISTPEMENRKITTVKDINMKKQQQHQQQQCIETTTFSKGNKSKHQNSDAT